MWLHAGKKRLSDVGAGDSLEEHKDNHEELIPVSPVVKIF
jgi:hypothetical protein